MTKARLFIDSQWANSSNGADMPVHDPSTGREIERVSVASKHDVGAAVDAAKDAFDSGRWSKLPPADRANILLKIASMLEEKADEFARLESRNSGKSLKQTSSYDVPYTIDNIRFIAGAARVPDGIPMAEYVADGTSGLRREPIGVVASIVPWNYPLMMVVWRTFPALATGNTVVLKPASYTPLTALLLTELLEKAGIPRGVFNVITGPGGSVGEQLASDASVDAIAFTGSTEVGRRLSELAAGRLKKVSLELGGKAPFIVLDDADIEAATEGAVVGGLVNNGEDCANSTRYYVCKSVMSTFQAKLIEKLKRVVVGDPSDLKTDMGPLISQSHRKHVQEYIKSGVSEGGRILYGGDVPKISPAHDTGFFLSPTVIRTENHDSKIVKDEIFGPVYTLFEVTGLEDAIRRSNDVIYGLGASVWTRNVTQAMRAVRDLRFGTVWVNEHVPVPSETPWPAWKQSGHGASLSKYCLEEFTYVKHVYFDLTGLARKSWYYQIYGAKT